MRRHRRMVIWCDHADSSDHDDGVTVSRVGHLRSPRQFGTLRLGLGPVAIGELGMAGAFSSILERVELRAHLDVM